MGKNNSSFGWFFAPFGKLRRKQSAKSRRKAERRLLVEPLERRQLLTLAPIALTTSPNPSTENSPVTLTANVSALSALPAHTVTFTDNGAPIAGESGLSITSNITHALHFSGDPDAYVQIPNMTLSDLTFVTWVQRDQIGEKQYEIMSGDYGGWGVYFSEGGDNDRLWFTWRGYAAWCSNVAVSDNNWHMVAVTLDGSTNTLAFYVDGQPAGTATAWGWFFGSGDYYLGGSPDKSNDPNQPLTGSLAETLIYDTTLTSSQIVGLYNNGLGTVVTSSAEGLYAGYDYAGSGTDVADFSGHGRDGLIVDPNNSITRVAGFGRVSADVTLSSGSHCGCAEIFNGEMQ